MEGVVRLRQKMRCDRRSTNVEWFIRPARDMERPVLADKLRNIIASALVLGVAVFCTPIDDAQAQVVSGCAPYPAFPDASCTGWQHTGVTLTTHSGSCTLSTAGAVYDSRQFNCDVTIAANNITIKRSAINGVVRLSGSSMKGILLEDVYVDGKNAAGAAGGQCIGGTASSPGGATAADFVIRRANIVGCEQGVYGRGWTLEDSYIHDLYCAGQDHTEPILGHTGKIVAIHNNITGNLRADTCSGGGQASAVDALYTHSSFWPDIDSVLFQYNRFQTGSGNGQGGYCVYGGDGGPGDSGNATNVIFKDNVFARGSTNKCGAFGPVTFPAEGAGSCWSNNRYEDGTVINSGGATPACSQEVKPAAPTNLSVT